MGVNGSESASQRRVSSPGGSSASARAPSRRRARRRSSAIWSSISSSNASRRRPPSWSPKWAASSAAARSGRRSSARSRAGSGSSVSCAAPRHCRASARIWVEDRPVGRRVGRHLPRVADRLAGRRVEGDAEAVAALVLALEQQPRARAVLALEPGLVEERRLHRPRRVGDHRLDERLHPAPAHRAAGDRAHLGDHRRGLVDRELADRARLLAVARQVLEQVADGQQPEPLRALGGGRRLRPRAASPAARAGDSAAGRRRAAPPRATGRRWRRSGSRHRL